MLKKAGIIVAASAAGILAFSPLAFAGSKGDDNGGSRHDNDDKKTSKVVKKDDDGDTKKDNLENECDFSNEGGDVDQGVLGGSSLAGAVGAVTGIAANATSQLDTLNCNNVNVQDVVDLDSNNEESTTTRTSVEDSFNGGDE